MTNCYFCFAPVSRTAGVRMESTDPAELKSVKTKEVITWERHPSLLETAHKSCLEAAALIYREVQASREVQRNLVPRSTLGLGEDAGAD
jgi:hypothetical protein